MTEETLNEDLLINSLKHYLPKKPILSSQGYGLRNIFVVRYEHPAHEIEEHSLPYNILEVIERHGTDSPHWRCIADNKYSEPLRGGEVLLYPQHCDHSVCWEKKVTFTLLLFKPQLFEKEFGCSSSADIFPFFQKCDRDTYELVNLILRGLEKNHIDSNYIDCLGLALANYLISFMGLRNKVCQEYRPSRQEIKEILDFIESEIESGRQPGIPELIKQVGLESQSYFIKLFQKEMGITPSKYIRQRAIERAKCLLRTTDIKITDISVQCGFSVRNFNDTFKKATGATPKDFRSEFR